MSYHSYDLLPELLLFPFVSLSLALLLFSSAGSWGCLQHCNQTQFVIPNQTKEIVLPGCSKQCTKQCTKNCTHCSLQNQEIVQAWWYYYNPDGTPIPNQNGFANRSSNYSINVRNFKNAYTLCFHNYCL